MYNLDLEAIQREIDRAPHGSKKALVREYADKFDMSVAQIYRMLKLEFGGKFEINRDPKTPKHLIDHIAELKVAGMNLSLKKRERATHRCIKQLKREGVEGAEELSKTTVNQNLKRYGFRDEQPRVLIEPDFVNQEWQMDFSRSKYFQIVHFDSGSKDWIMRASGKELHYKQEDKRLRSWIVQAKESASRMRLAKCYAATGEDGFIGLNFLDWCWRREPDANPMRHVPHILKTDNGAFHKRRESRETMRALGIDFRSSAPGNSASQGKVESGFKSIWGEFEVEFSIICGGHGSLVSLSDYNEALHQFVSGENAEKIHPRQTEKTLREVYKMGILKVAPRQVEENVLRIACKVEQRKVPPTLLVQYKSPVHGKLELEAPAHCINKWIYVKENMQGEILGELIEGYTKTPFVLKPYRIRQYDNYEHRPTNPYRAMIEANVAAKTSPPLQGEAGGGNIRYMKPKTKTIAPDSDFTRSDTEPVEAFENIYHAKIYIGQRLRPLGETYDYYADVFDEMLAEDLTKHSIDAVLSQIKQYKKAM